MAKGTINKNIIIEETNKFFKTHKITNENIKKLNIFLDRKYIASMRNSRREQNNCLISNKFKNWQNQKSIKNTQLKFNNSAPNDIINNPSKIEGNKYRSQVMSVSPIQDLLIARENKSKVFSPQNNIIRLQPLMSFTKERGKYLENENEKKVPWSKLINHNKNLKERILRQEQFFEKHRELKLALNTQINEKKNREINENKISKLEEE